MIDSETLKHLIELIDADIKILSEETRLCNPYVEDIVFKYELHGSIDKTIIKLKELKQSFVDGTYTGKMVIRIINREEDWNNGVCNNQSPYKERMKKFLETDNGRGYRTLQKREKLRINKLHEKKECVCFL